MNKFNNLSIKKLEDKVEKENLTLNLMVKVNGKDRSLGTFKTVKSAFIGAMVNSRNYRLPNQSAVPEALKSYNLYKEKGEEEGYEHLTVGRLFSLADWSGEQYRLNVFKLI